ncbi:MAG: hypothetical protein JRH15_07850 [Deltaproteobacteria bacterium]|nr:hypothetical protein [Deltaproteobacteria bacterium]
MKNRFNQWVKNIFSKEQEIGQDEDIMAIANMIEPIIDETVTDVVKAHYDKLLEEPAVYIVPAVWGGDKSGQLDDTQQALYQQIAPILSKVFDALRMNGMSTSQQFAIGYLVRGYVLLKIAYILESSKNMQFIGAQDRQERHEYMKNVKPIGNA